MKKLFFTVTFNHNIMTTQVSTQKKETKFKPARFKGVVVVIHYVSESLIFQDAFETMYFKNLVTASP